MIEFAIIREAEAMVEAGAISPDASLEALEYLATKYVIEQHRKNQRKNARRSEAPAKRLNAQSAAEKRIETAVTRIVADRTPRRWVDLLSKPFSLRDGRKVLWGVATIQDHQERARMLQAMASGNLEVAAMHRAAVLDIQSAGVRTLRRVGQEDEMNEEFVTLTKAELAEIIEDAARTALETVKDDLTAQERYRTAEKEKRAAATARARTDPEVRTRINERARLNRLRRLETDPDFRTAQTKKNRDYKHNRYHNDPEWRAKWNKDAATASARTPKDSAGPSRRTEPKSERVPRSEKT